MNFASDPALMGPLVLLMAGWCSGISLYLTAALLGISGRMGWIQLPGELGTLSNFFIIVIAVLLFLVEFVADKVPYVDSAWDSIHTFIRPAGAVAMGYLGGSEHGAVAQTLFALLTGTIALNVHAVKASSRLVINTSPEPFSNIAASTTENAGVFFIFWFFIKHPVITCIVLVALLVLSFFFLRMVWRFVVKLFKRETPKPVAQVGSNKVP